MGSNRYTFPPCHFFLPLSLQPVILSETHTFRVGFFSKSGEWKENANSGKRVESKGQSTPRIVTI